MDIPINRDDEKVFVQACRESDVKFLQSPEGQEMLNKALAHIKSQLPERDYSKPIPNMGKDAYSLIMDLNKTIAELTADRDEWKQQHQNLLSVRESDLQVITSLRQQLTKPADEVLIEAAKAVVERWETPLWKDAPATAKFIYRLRDAINAYKPTEG
jgi:hypothetical protein